MKQIHVALIIVFMVLLQFVCYSQQQAQYSLYMANNFTLNPAVAGTEGFTDIKVGYRSQWLGFEGSPNTVYISGHTSLNKQITEFTDVKPMAFHGVGGFIYSDDTGPTTQLGAYGSYAYHLPITKKLTASLGTFIGFQQYKIDESELLFHDDQFNVEDKTVNGTGTKFLPDAHLGLWLYHESFYAGLAVYQLFNNKLDFESVENATKTGELNRHYFLTAGVRVPIGSSYTIVPSLVVRQVSPAPIQLDVNVKLRYNQILWLGASYRIKDAFVLLVGGTIKSKFDLAYAYDVTTSRIRNHSLGSHEIIIGYRIAKKDKIVPAQFW